MSVLNLTVDMSQVALTIDPGMYPAIVQSVKLHTRADSNPPSYSLKWEFSIADGEFKGMTITDFTSLKPNALYRLNDRLIALGKQEEAIGSNGQLALSIDETSGLVLTPQFEGLPCLLTIVNEVYEGRDRAQVSDVLPMKSAVGLGKEGGDKKVARPKVERLK